MQSNENFLNQKDNFLAKLSVYAGQLQLKMIPIFMSLNNIMPLVIIIILPILILLSKELWRSKKIKTKFTIGKGSQIYANQLTIFNGQRLYLNNQGSIITHNIMNINADLISNIR